MQDRMQVCHVVLRRSDRVRARRTRLALCLVFAALAALVASSLLVVVRDARCRIPMNGGAPGDECNGHACTTPIHGIRFENGNCSDRSTFAYCYTDVSERLFFGQELCLQQELMQGVRVFFVQAQLQGRRLQVCHRLCIGKQEGVEEMLSVFAEFLRLNPREVLILWWFPHGDETRFAAALQHVYLQTGLAQHTFTSEATQWPAIGELVEADTRLISLVDGSRRDPTPRDASTSLVPSQTLRATRSAAAAS